MTFKLKQVSDAKITPVKIPKINKDDLAGGDVFDMPYFNMTLLARKKSGKTSVINKILSMLAGKNTTVVIFCPTIALDPTYQEIKKRLEEREINALYYDDIFDDDGLPILPMLIESMKRAIENPPEPEVEVICHFNPITCSKTYEEKPVAEKKEKKIHPRFIIVFDDMSHRLKDPNIARLTKIHRHLRADVIISTQAIHDIPPNVWKQMDYLLLFRALEEEKLALLHDRVDLSVNLPTFLKIYSQATAEPYSFLFVEVRTDNYRRNFTDLFLLEK